MPWDRALPCRRRRNLSPLPLFFSKSGLWTEGNSVEESCGKIRVRGSCKTYEPLMWPTSCKMHEHLMYVDHLVQNARTFDVADLVKNARNFFDVCGPPRAKRTNLWCMWTTSCKIHEPLMWPTSCKTHEPFLMWPTSCKMHEPFIMYVDHLVQNARTFDVCGPPRAKRTNLWCGPPRVKRTNLWCGPPRSSSIAVWLIILSRQN